MTRKMVPRVLPKTLASSSSRYPKTAPTFSCTTPLRAFFGRFWGSRARTCAGFSRNLGYHFEAQKTRKKMAPKVLSETLPISSSAYPKIAILDKSFFLHEPRIWPIWDLSPQVWIGAFRALPHRYKGVKENLRNHLPSFFATRKMVPP